MNLSNLLSSKELSCFEDCDDLEALHGYTLKLWTILDAWRVLRNSLMQKPFLKMNFSEVTDFIEESLSFIDQKL